jgi:hypothetical protein
MKYPAVHAQRLETWLGKDQLRQLIESCGDFYHPIRVANVPGEIDIFRGDFFGRIDGGQFANLHDRIVESPGFKAKQLHDRVLRGIADDFAPPLEFRSDEQRHIRGGFSSLSDLISEATTGGKRQDWIYSKAGALAVNASYGTLWRVGNLPAGGAAGAALAAGTNCDRTTTGALAQTDPGGGDTLHAVSAYMLGTAAPNTMLFFDRLWHGAMAMSSSANQTITHTLPRYATTTSPGNFCTVETTTTLSNTAHTLTLEYKDQDDATAESAAAFTAINTCAQDRLDLSGNWFIPLNSPDTGFRSLTHIANSSASVTGGLNVVAGHPLFFIPCPVANSMVVMDGINSAFNLVKVLAGACIAALEFKGTASATTYHGQIILVSG